MASRSALSRGQNRLFSSSPFIHATPLPLTAQGPPPPPPHPAATHAEARLAYQRKRATQIDHAQSAIATRAGPRTRANGDTAQKRFWRTVSVRESPEGWQIYLDNRPLRFSTPPRSVLTLPPSKRLLALLLAQEWDSLPSAAHALKMHNIPLTGLINRASQLQQSPTFVSPLEPPTSDLRDFTVKARSDIVEMCMRYLDTDTILCYAPETNSSLDVHVQDRQVEERESLRDMQKLTAGPIIHFLTASLFPGISLVPHTTDELIPAPQPGTTKQMLREWLVGLPSWELAALEMIVLATKSLLIGIRTIAEWSCKLRALPGDTDLTSRDREPTYGTEEACEAASVEVRWQTAMWGEVEDTHDVDRQEMRRQIASAIALVVTT